MVNKPFERGDTHTQARKAQRRQSAGVCEGLVATTETQTETTQGRIFTVSEALSTLKKINPLVMVLSVVLIIVSNTVVFDSSQPFERRAMFFALSFAMLLAVAAYEVVRIGREEQLEEEALRRKFFGG